MCGFAFPVMYSYKCYILLLLLVSQVKFQYVPILLVVLRIHRPNIFITFIKKKLFIFYCFIF